MISLSRLCGLSAGRHRSVNCTRLIYNTCGKSVLLLILQKRGLPQNLLLLTVDVISSILEDRDVLLQMAQHQGTRSILRAMTNSSAHIEFIHRAIGKLLTKFCSREMEQRMRSGTILTSIDVLYEEAKKVAERGPIKTGRKSNAMTPEATLQKQLISAGAVSKVIEVRNANKND